MTLQMTFVALNTAAVAEEEVSADHQPDERDGSYHETDPEDHLHHHTGNLEQKKTTLSIRS